MNQKNSMGFFYQKCISLQRAFMHESLNSFQKQIIWKAKSKR